MNGKHLLISIIVQGGIAVCIIAAATVLAALRVLDSSAVVGLFGAVIGFAGGATATTSHALRGAMITDQQQQDART
jgi:hypothetical protein